MHIESSCKHCLENRHVTGCHRKCLFKGMIFTNFGTCSLKYSWDLSKLETPGFCKSFQLLLDCFDLILHSLGSGIEVLGTAMVEWVWLILSTICSDGSWWSWCSSWLQNISLLGTRGFLKQTPTKLLPAGWHASATNHKSDPTALRTLASPQRSCMFNHHIDTSKNTETLIFKMSWRCKTVRFRTKFVTWTLNLSVQGSQASRSCPHPSRLWCYPQCRPAFQYPRHGDSKIALKMVKIGIGTKGVSTVPGLRTPQIGEKCPSHRWEVEAHPAHECACVSRCSCSTKKWSLSGHLIAGKGCNRETTSTTWSKGATRVLLDSSSPNIPGT